MNPQINTPNKPYDSPQLTVYGTVEEVTGAIFWSGTGDLWSSAIEDLTHGHINPPDGCGPFASKPSICSTGS